MKKPERAEGTAWVISRMENGKLRIVLRQDAPNGRGYLNTVAAVDAGDPFLEGLLESCAKGREEIEAVLREASL